MCGLCCSDAKGLLSLVDVVLDKVMAEVEIFLRFSEIAVETKKRDVIQVGPPGSCGYLP